MATRIYTKTGDDGTTGLFGGGRVPKDDPRIEAYGCVDELNTVLGCARASGGITTDHDAILGTLQDQLFVLGADLATPERKDRQNISIPRVTPDDVTCLESLIDRLEESLPALRHFILPGGGDAGATLHLARTVARRAERKVVSLLRSEPDVGPIPLEYLNRLSDLLFVLARAVNHAAGIEEKAWIPNPRTKAD